MNGVKWGIIGAGGIANKFVESLKQIGDAEISAVGSRDAGRAAEYARRYGAKRYYGSFEELANDPEVDIIYVATPHSAHFDNTMLCLNAGKAVLCEKPFTINANQAKKLVETARSKKVFLMEAMWTRYLPAIVKLRDLLSSGAIGDIRMIKADFCFRTDLVPEARLFNPDLGGGALLDVGIYPISFASMLAGPNPSGITSSAHIGITGVDEQCTVTLTYPGGLQAVLTAAIRTEAPQDAWVFGTEGYIRIPEFWHTNRLELHRNGKTEILEVPFLANGYAHEALESMKCLKNGRLESEIMPLDESIRLMELLDGIREQWGLKYPGE